MHLIFDHILASIVAGGIFLSLVVVQHRNQEFAAETAAFYALRAQQIAFIETLERDFQNISSLDDAAVTGTGTFRFESRTQPGSSVKHDVVYQVVPAVGGRPARVERWVEGTLLGHSPAELTLWTVQARNAEGEDVADPADARQLYVRFELKPLPEALQDLDRATWDAVFRPPLLQEGATL